MRVVPVPLMAEKRIATIYVVEEEGRAGVEVRAAFADPKIQDVVFPAKDVDQGLRLLRSHVLRQEGKLALRPKPDERCLCGHELRDHYEWATEHPNMCEASGCACKNFRRKRSHK